MNGLIANKEARARHDSGPASCSNRDNATSLPPYARLPINRCNLPAVILGSLTFQRSPTALAIDGIAELHDGLFDMLDRTEGSAEAAQLFRDYIAAHFRLDNLEDAGLDDASNKRAKANWVRTLRGWSFDSDGREGAVLKGWVESRFGLVPRFHREPLRDFTGPAWRRYEEMRAAGLYGTNALEAQLDLLYAYCQYDFRRRAVDRLRLYRGINRIGEHEVLASEGKRQVVLFNNLASFTANRERAGEFGDYILEADVPAAKVFFHSGLLPGVLRGEDEHLVIGGAYEIVMRTL